MPSWSAVLRRYKFQPFQDVLAAEALEHQGSRHAVGMVVDQHQNEPVHAVAETGKG